MTTENEQWLDVHVDAHPLAIMLHKFLIDAILLMWKYNA